MCDPDPELEQAMLASPVKALAGADVAAGHGAGVAGAGAVSSAVMVERSRRIGRGRRGARREPVDEGQFEVLKAWRFERAEGKPAFTVAANAVLEEVLRRRPRSLEELIEIRGIGPAFCEKHGESLLAELSLG